ncbi:hypothetical protein, partial [Microtetraspora niveoalba]|uniref:hypothetical protein n=1 Tax=Microtetraspora niveoalba TaxID=46175 RepID=UPI001C3F4C50
RMRRAAASLRLRVKLGATEPLSNTTGRNSGRIQGGVAVCCRWLGADGRVAAPVVMASVNADARFFLKYDIDILLEILYEFDLIGADTSDIIHTGVLVENGGGHDSALRVRRLLFGEVARR